MGSIHCRQGTGRRPGAAPSARQCTLKYQINLVFAPNTNQISAEINQIRPNQITGQRETNTNTPNQITEGDQIYLHPGP